MHRVVQVTNLFTKTHNEILKSQLAKEDVQQIFFMAAWASWAYYNIQ